MRALLDQSLRARVAADMRATVRVVVRGCAVASVLLFISALPGPMPTSMRDVARPAHAEAPAQVPYARFQVGNVVAWGILDGDRLREVAGDPGADATLTGRTFHVRAVTILDTDGRGRAPRQQGNAR